MHIEFVDILKNFLLEYGLILCEEPEKLQDLLEKQAGEHKREIRLLLNGIQQGIVQTLRYYPGDNIDNFALENLIEQLEKELGITREFAQWTVYTWAEALGKKINQEQQVSVVISDQPLTILRSWHEHNSSVYGLSFSPHGKMLASASWDGTVKLWQIQYPHSQRTLLAHDRGINALNFTLDSKIIATGSGDKKIKLWDVFTGEHIRTIEAHNNVIWSLACHPKGELLASASADTTIKFWQLPESHLAKTLTAHTQGCRVLAFSPDGKYLASGGRDSKIKLWTGFTGLEKGVLYGHIGSITSLAFYKNSQKLISGGDDLILKIWNLKTKEEEYSWFAHEDMITAIALHPSKEYIVSASVDGIVKIWSQPDKILHEIKITATSLCFHPQEDILAIGQNTGEIIVYKLNI